MVQSRRVFAGEKRKPSGSSTAWSAMSLAAARYLSKSAGDSDSASAALVKPSPAAPSAGKSCAGCKSTAGQIANGRSCTRHCSAGAGCLAPGRRPALAPPHRGNRAPRRAAACVPPAVGCGCFLGGISPVSSISIIACHGLRSLRTWLERGESFQIEVAFFPLRGVATEAVLLEERLNDGGVFVFRFGGSWLVGAARAGEGECAEDPAQRPSPEGGTITSASCFCT